MTATTYRRETTGWASLTPTEYAVVELLLEGGTNRVIGDRLGVSRRTVETHLAHVFLKLGVDSRVSVATQAARRGMGGGARFGSL